MLAFQYCENRSHLKGRPQSLRRGLLLVLDVRTNDNGDLVVTKGDQYDVREQTKENEVRNLGKPVELAGQYYIDGADEVSFLNITGFRDFPLGYLPMLQILKYTAENVFVPLTVGGGIRDFTDANGRYYSSLEVDTEYFRSGADKIYERGVQLELMSWQKLLKNWELGRYCSTVMGKGFDIDLVNLISDAVSIPVIASSGAGKVEHFSEVFSQTNAAGIFHRKEVPIQSVKDHLLKKGIEVRI
ncbi:hypothetical protein L1987_08063 [Smallanthus sonchifolius]|uniref:Uncharacterized protein n=1 Tax=Smallanthus sonchifolius TaxID=185202 RepID=A0ACB9JJN9_9ASTR|nr:hypothetical protein L1987_08063 [Smallanthus sonchifolius]